MELNEAIELIKNDDLIFSEKSSWADLGCGSGTFTLALARLLQPHSTIHALDKNMQALNAIPGNYKHITIEKYQLDFEKDEMMFPGLDGILMANSLHYIKDKKSFLGKIKTCIRTKGSLLLIEYDTENANPWVPYPLSYSSAKTLFETAGFSFIKKFHERISLFGRANLYSMLATL